MYDLRYKPPAEKYFKKIKEKQLKAEFASALSEISKDPYKAGQMKTGDLAGIYCRDVYHNKATYEIAYQIIEQNSKIVVVIIAGTRENFYRELKRYMGKT